MNANILDIGLYAAGLGALLVIYWPFSPMTIDLVIVSRDTQVAIYRRRHVLWGVVLLCLAALVVRGMMGWSEPVWMWVTGITAAMMAMMFWTSYVPFVMTPPARHRLLDSDEAKDVIGDDEAVLGVASGGEARAYPRDMIARPHFFNDTVGETPLTVSYCILCNSAMAFKSELAGRPLDLQCVTAANNNIIYLDPASGNFIQQLDGRVFAGPDKGAELEPHPVVLTTWGEWRRRHPEARLYHAPPLTLRDKLVAGMLGVMIPISRLSRRKKPWHRVKHQLDARLPAMSFVLGVERGGDTCAFPIEALASQAIMNETVGGEPIAVFYSSVDDVAQVFSRTVDGRVLSFRPATGEGGIVAEDEETGSRWDLEGHGCKGELAGRSLDSVPHWNKLFWFSWALFKPGTRLASV